MIKIVLLLLLFLVYASVHQEGLRNYTPITTNTIVNNKPVTNVYGVNVIKNHPANIYTRLTTPGDSLYDEKYKKMKPYDILIDMQYFNNASYLIFKLNN
jgi:hypothetical protein